MVSFQAVKLDSPRLSHKKFNGGECDYPGIYFKAYASGSGAQGKALLPGEQCLRETEVVGPDLAGCLILGSETFYKVIPS